MTFFVPILLNLSYPDRKENKMDGWMDGWGHWETKDFLGCLHQKISVRIFV